jgi:hypothetical protein
MGKQRIRLNYRRGSASTLMSVNCLFIKQLTEGQNCTRNSGDVMKLWMWLFVGSSVTGISFRLIVVTHASWGFSHRRD